MKKVFLVFLVAMTFCAFAQEQRISTDQLPEKAQIFLQESFKNASVVKAILETDDDETEYNVVLSNGIKIKFNEFGKWQKIESKKATFPTYFIPDALVTHCQKNYPDAIIRKVEKTHRNDISCFEVKLSNGIELVWNSQSREITID